MNETQKQIFDQYIEWLECGGDIYMTLDGLKAIAPPEAIPHIQKYIKRISENWIEWGWGESLYSELVIKAREVMDAIYIKAGQEAFFVAENVTPDDILASRKVWLDGGSKVTTRLSSRELDE